MNATFLESLLDPGTESGKNKMGGRWWWGVCLLLR